SFARLGDGVAAEGDDGAAAVGAVEHDSRKARILATPRRALQRLLDAGHGFGLGVDAVAPAMGGPGGVGLRLPRLHERQIAASSDEAGVRIESVLEELRRRRQVAAV